MSFVKRMMIALIMGVAIGTVFSLLHSHLSATGNEGTWDIINRIFFQDITVAEGRSALGLFYIVQTLFMNALQLSIVPMVFFSIILSVCGMDDMRKLGRIASKTLVTFLLFYLTACAFAAGVATIAKNAGFFAPITIGEAATAITEIETSNVLTTVVNAVPNNLMSVLTVNNKVVAVVFCAVVIGICITALSGKLKIIQTVIEDCNTITQRFLDFIISECSPIAIFCMIVRTFSIYGLNQMKPLASYILTTIIALIIYLFVAYPIGIFISTGVNPVRFMKKIMKAGVIAFGAAASAPALPLNRKTCIEELGCSQPITNFVLPLGMTINMNGTAIMHIIACTFIATSAGEQVTLTHFVLMTLLAIASSVGTPSVPAAGSVMAYAVLTGAGFTSESCALIYSLVLALNKPCEMVLTVLNVVGDAATALIVSKSEGELDKDVYYGKKAVSMTELEAS